MTFLSDIELAQIRSDVAFMLPDLCNILSQAGTADGYGGITDVWGTAIANTPCRFDILQRSEQEVQAAGAALQDFYRFKVTLPYETVVTTDNRIEKDDVVYTVVSVDTGKSWEISRRCVVERL